MCSCTHCPYGFPEHGCLLIYYSFVFCRRRHVTSHRSSSFTLLQSLAIEDSRDKPTYSVLLGQLFAFIGTSPDQAVGHNVMISSEWLLAAEVSITVKVNVLSSVHFRCPVAASFWLHRQGGGGATLGSRPWCTCGNC